jgi:HSP20 family molecular chaperone IbpA
MNKALSLFDIPQLTDRFIGFDDLFGQMEMTMNSKMDMSFPPYDIYTEEVAVVNQKGKIAEGHTETHTFIKFALAGIKKADIRVVFENNTLTVYNEKNEEDEKKVVAGIRKNIRLGIAQRKFKISKTISKDLELVGATHEDGCLIIEFKKKEIKEAKSQFIDIK